MARFGKVIVSQWNGSAEDSKAIQERMARDLPKISAEIDMLVENIAARVARLPPEQLLLRSWWEFAGASVLPDRKPERSGGVDADARICPECNRLCEADDRVI